MRKKFENVLVLAGGESNRFWPLKNKHSYSFFGEPNIISQLNKLSEFSENIFVIAGNTNIEMIQEKIKNFKVKAKVIKQKENLKGQAGAVLSASKEISGECLIVNANDFFDISILDKMSESISEEKKDLLFLAKEVKSYFPGGYVEFSGERINKIIEKPDQNRTPSNIVKLVVDYLGNFKGFADVLEMIDTEKDDWYEQGLNLILKTSQKTSLILYEKEWISLKYPWHLLTLMKNFLSKIDESKIESDTLISPRAVIVPPVIIGHHVRVGDFSKIVGPCYIGDGTIIGDYSMVRESHIGNDCLIGGYSEVARSYLCDNVYLHRNYIGDSILDENVLMGSGVVTANFRFDKSNIFTNIKGMKVDTGMDKFGTVVGSDSKIGINASVLPGKLIGKNTFISPGEKISKNLSDDSFFYLDKEAKNKT